MRGSRRRQKGTAVGQASVDKLGAALAACMLLLVACGSAEQAKAPLADDSEAAVSRAVDAITTFPEELDPRLWNGMALKPELRSAILRVVDRVARGANIEGLAIDGVDLFGSNVSYEYDDSSDVGVHVFVHKPGMAAKELNPFLELLNDQVERRQEGRILLNGLPLEVTFHAERSASYRSIPGIGQYSVADGRWLVEPVPQPDNFDPDQIKADAKRFIGEYNSLVRGYESDKKVFDCAGFGELDQKMSEYRRQGFDQNLGSRSTQNLTYRLLRRLNVSIPEMVDTLEDECTFIGESVG